MYNRCGDCDYLNYRDSKWGGEQAWCNYKGYYVKKDSVACNNYTYHGHCYGRYLTTFVCDILNVNEDFRKKLYKTFDDIRFNKTKDIEKYFKLYEEYDIIGPSLVDKLNKDKFKYSIAESMFFDYIIPCYNLIQEDNYLEALEKYIDMTNKLYFYYCDKTITKVRK